jgi:hypothetical protein
MKRDYMFSILGTIDPEKFGRLNKNSRVDIETIYSSLNSNSTNPQIRIKLPQLKTAIAEELAKFGVAVEGKGRGRKKLNKTSKSKISNPILRYLLTK